MDLTKIEKILRYCFRDRELLKLAFVHRSYWNEHQEEVEGHNERLEFVGDAVLDLLIADYLYQNLSGAEGRLSHLRASLVDSQACASYIEELDLAPYLLLGKGEELNQGKGRQSILADLFEAILAALYLDGGLEAARAFFLFRFESRIQARIAEPVRNWKAELQDVVQKKHKVAPKYRLVEQKGPEHALCFHVAVFVQGEKWGEGKGSSKKQAEMEAAKVAMERIK